MSEAFDPYHRWLGIPAKDQPPHHYRLLGIDLFEDDTEVIRDANERQMAHVRKYQLGQHSAISQKILNEIAAAKACLIDPLKKAAYDRSLKPTLIRPPAPPPSPPIQNVYTDPPAFRTYVEKTSDFIKRLTSSRHIRLWLLCIGLGITPIIGGILITIFVISSNKHAPATAKSNVQIAKVIERVKQNPPIENASGEMPGNDKPEEQKISATIPKALPGVDYSASEKDQTTHSNKEPKTNEPQIQIKPFPPPGTSTEQKIDVKDIQNLFEVGLKSQSGSWEDAKERFEAICKRGEDPRLYYAWGIVCLYRNRNEEALNAFQKSTQTDRLVYLPAWQILARTQALKGQYNETLETLVRLARVLEQDAKWPDEQSRIECASWCGWMMAFFQAIGKKSEKIKTAAAQCNMEILSILSGKRRMSYEDGVKYAMDQPPIVAINAHHTTMSPYIERQLAEQDKKLKNVQDKKDKLKHKAQKDEEEYKNGKDQIEKKGAELETTYKNLTSQCDALQKNIPQLEQQRSNVKSQWDISHANNLAVQNIQLTNAINTQQAFLSTAQKQADQVKRQGLDLVKARDLLTVQYQQTSQQSLAQIEQLEKLVNSIEDKIKKLKNTLPVESDPSNSSMSKTITECFPLDFEMEKQKILASFPAEVHK